MKLGFSKDEEAFRQEAAEWLKEHLTGPFEILKHRGGPGDEHMFQEERKAWEQELAKGGWTCLGWPEEHGGKGLDITKQVIFQEEYARAGGPGRVGHIGEGLAGPTIIAFGTEEQKKRYLPGIKTGKELWCQGYSEPNAGSDLANVQTKARFNPETNKWSITGQKVWTSLAGESDYCFVIARTDPDSTRHKGLGFFLVPMDQDGIELRPIRQLTGTSEFYEVFFDQAQCDKDSILGAPGDGWKIAMELLGFERGVSTLGQQMLFQNELNQVIAKSKETGVWRKPRFRQDIAEAHIGLKIMRYNSLRMLSGGQEKLSKEALIYKLYWAGWHRRLGELAMQAWGPQAEIIAGPDYELHRLQSLFLFVRSDTIYGGTDEIQKNIIAERGLGMPKG